MALVCGIPCVTLIVERRNWADDSAIGENRLENWDDSGLEVFRERPKPISCSFVESFVIRTRWT